MCKKEKQIMMYLLGELDKDEENEVLSHLNSCPECLTVFQKLEKIHSVLKERKTMPVPDGLLNQCLEMVHEPSPRRRKELKLKEWINRWIPLTRPVLKWAFIVIVFCSGLGLGKLLFDTPYWLKKSLPGRMYTEYGIDNQLLRNYLMSVEMLFLDISNIEDPSLLGDLVWTVEIDNIQKVLNRTRQVRIQIPNQNSDLSRLIAEIEVTLKDVLDAAQYDLAIVPVELQQNMEQYRILDRINEYVL